MSQLSAFSWEDSQVFLAVAEQGSFSAAALALGVGQATVSRRIARLEAQLGCALFARGRRGTALTSQGARMLPPAQQMSRWAAELQATIASTEQGVEGCVTIASGTGTARDFLVPLAALLRLRTPALRFELRTGVDYADLARGEADIGLRARRSTEPALVTLAAFSAPIRPFASAAYLARLDAPPRHVSDVDWVCWGNERAHIFPRQQLAALIPGFEPVFAANEYMLQVEACEAGMGAMMLPAIHHPIMQDSPLHELELDFGPFQQDFFVVCARSMQHVPRVRAVLDALLEALDELEVT